MYSARPNAEEEEEKHNEHRGGKRPGGGKGAQRVHCLDDNVRFKFPSLYSIGEEKLTTTHGAAWSTPLQSTSQRGGGGHTYPRACPTHTLVPVRSTASQSRARARSPRTMQKGAYVLSPVPPFRAANNSHADACAASETGGLALFDQTSNPCLLDGMISGGAAPLCRRPAEPPTGAWNSNIQLGP